MSTEMILKNLKVKNYQMPHDFIKKKNKIKVECGNRSKYRLKIQRQKYAE